ncbi:hypothetical protein ACJEIK_26205 [Mycobacterium sp. SMC-16]|uniref:hypothetical protein n=1 Tax=Mycobacterium sp. SMC-16 TaxID=3385967 RepID=UPI00390C7812
MKKLATEDKIDTRAAIYAAGQVGVAIALFLGVIKVIDPSTANAVVNIVQLLGGLLGGGAAVTAASVLKAQKRVPGMLEPTPEQPPVVDQIINGLSVLAENHAQVASEIDKVTAAAKDALGNLPVVGLGAAAIAEQAGSLAQQVIAAAAAVNAK